MLAPAQDVILHGKRHSSFFIKDKDLVSENPPKELKITVDPPEASKKSYDFGEEEEEISPLERLLIYLEDNLNKLFHENGKTVGVKTILREKILEVLDSIPQSLLDRLNKSALVSLKSAKVQTDESHGNSLSLMPSINVPRALTKRKSSFRIPNLNILAKSIDKLRGNKKEKVQGMSENNAFKLIETLLDERVNLEIENEINNKKTKPLPNFVLDQLSMRFGLKTLAVK